MRHLLLVTALSRYVVGIDLGTTNSALAYVDRRSGRGARTIRQLEIPQLVAPGAVEARPMLPSSVYIVGEHDVEAQHGLPPDQTKLPWREGCKPGELVVGELARHQGAKVPGRLVTSAKSWLCHPGVDRRASILPWGAPPEVPKHSPVEVSTAILAHLRDAWDHLIAQGDPKKKLAAQEVVLTVPASFDEVARELTLEAAKRAGLTPVLLEEPQAALYSWIADHEAEWTQQLRPEEQILVVDVGGGTTDFSLVSVTKAPPPEEGQEPEDNDLSFERTAVGDHLLLGGDNMDLALARRIEERLTKRSGQERLDAARWHALAYACRGAKEKLLTGAPDEKVPVVVAGRGSSVIGGALKEDVSGEEVRDVVLAGFFPFVPRDEPPLRRPRVGLAEFGLPYVQEPAITRHLRAFLARHGTAPALARVDWVLWNGGVLTPAAVRERVLDAVARWADKRPGELQSQSLDLAVSRGAAYHALVRRGRGTRIKSGAGHAYYLEVGGVSKTARSALCLIPRGLEPLKEVAIADHPLELRANAPAAFPFFGSTVREDKPGEIVGLDDDFDELPPVHTVIRLKKRSSKRTSIPVTLSAKLTELGTLELWLVAREGERRWKLDFDTRGAHRELEDRKLDSSTSTSTSTSTAAIPMAEEGVAAIAGAPDEDVGRVLEIAPEKVEKARAFLRESFDVPAAQGQKLEKVGRELEAILEQPRESWPVPVIRKLADVLLEQRSVRARSPEHEARWLNLTGFCLRPGFGAALDEHRVSELWKVRLEGLKHPSKDACRLEWLVAWRRAAGGLGKGQQEELFAEIQSTVTGGKRNQVPRQEAAELWRTTASLELLPARKKADLGDFLLKLLESGEAPPRWGPWALGRLGAREPLYGPLDRLVPAEKATAWLERAVKLKLKERDELVFALVQLARLTGDRTRDVPDDLRARAKKRVLEIAQDPRAARPLEEVVTTERRTEGSFYGDSVPVGLVLAK